MPESSQRIFPRAEGEYVAWYQIADQGFHRCVALDIGIDGACLRVLDPLPEGQSLEVSFQLTDDWLVRAAANIIWQRPEDGEVLVGVRYRPVRSADRSLMGPWIHQQRRRLNS